MALEKTRKAGIYRRNARLVFVLTYVDAQGRRKQRWVSKGEDGQPFRSIEAADKERTRLKYRRDTGLDINPQRYTVAEYGARWLAYRKRTVSNNTYLSYKNALARLEPVIGKVTIALLRPDHIRDLVEKLADQGYTEGTVNKTKSILSEVLNTATDDGLVPRNVAMRVKGVPNKKRDFYLPTPAELTRLLKEADARGIGPLVRLGVLTGMRISEMFALTWADVDFDKGSLRIKASKTPAGVRPLSIDAAAIRLLRDLREEGGAYRLSGPVFTYKAGKSTRPWQAARKAAGLGMLHFHDLRHIHASLLIERGVDFKMIQERLGHSKVSTTLDLYGHLRPAADAVAAREIELALGMEER